jgi:class 3 adenylate cyclase
MDAAGAPHPVLFGFAEGGQIAALFAAQHPDRVAGLMTYGMWPYVREDEIEAWESWIAWATERWGSLEVAIGTAREVQPSRADDLAFVEWIARLHRGSLSPGTIEPLMRTDMALDVRDVLPTISVPTMVMHRERDSSVDASFLATVADLIPEARHVVLPGVDHWISADPQAPMFDAIQAFLQEIDGHRISASRRLATVMFTDIVGSTERSAELGDTAWSRLLTEHHDRIRGALAGHGGREIATEGDGFFATFDGPAAATRCAIDAVGSIREIGLQIRAGIHTGEVETIDGEIGGLGVAIGARVAALAGPSEVLVSQTVKDLVAGSGLRFEDAGEHELKGVPDRWRLYRVVDA